MRVLTAAIRYAPAPGGAEDHVHEVVNHLVQRGHELVVYTSDMWKEHPFERMTEPHDVVDGVRVVRKRTFQMTKAIHYPFMPGMFDMLREPADVVHSHSFGYYHTNVAALRKRLEGTPLVITPHYHPPETMQGGFARHQLRRVYDSHVANWVFEQADAILFNTHSELASMAHHIDDMDKASARPSFAILIYPVITMTDQYTHKGSQRNLLGANPETALIEKYSNEKQVTPQTPPTFLVHTQEDPTVPVENSIYFYLALCEAKVPAEMHLYQKGPHGFGLGRPGIAASDWPQRCAVWLRINNLLGSN